MQEGELVENLANAVAAVRNAAPTVGERIEVIGTSESGPPAALPSGCVAYLRARITTGMRTYLAPSIY